MIGVDSIMAIDRDKGSVERLKSGNFRLRVTIGYYENGNPNRISKIVKVSTERKAYIELEKWLDDLEEHGYEDLSSMTFGAFYNDIWLKKIKGHLEPRSYSDYKEIIEYRFLPTFKNKVLQDIKPYMIRDIVENAKWKNDPSKNITRKTKKKHLNAISNIFNLAMTDYQIIKRNPVSEIRLKRIKGEKKRVEAPYSLKEIELLFEALNKNETELKTKALIYTAFVTGARLAEIAALEESDIDYRNKRVRFHQRIVSYTNDENKKSWKRMDGLKNADEKTFSIPDDYLELMKGYAKVKAEERESLGTDPDHKYFFGYPDGTFQIPTSLSRRWVVWARRNGLRHIRFHDLRHTSASYLIANPSIPVKVVQERLGHASYQTTMNMYVSGLEESDRQASDVFQNAIHLKEDD